MHKKLSAKQKMILETLLNVSGVTAEVLAARIGSTPGCLRVHIHGIRKKYGLQFITSRNGKYCIVADARASAELALQNG